MTRWSVRVAMDETLDQQRQDEVRKWLPDAEITVDESRGRTEVALPVEAATLRQAADRGLRQIREAVASTPVGLNVQTEQDRDAGVGHPPVPDLVGLTEIGKILRVSKQRAGQLTKGKGFPTPVAHPASGPLYARTAVEQFDRTWERRKGRPPKTQAPTAGGDAR